MTLDDEAAGRDVFAHKTDEFVAQWLENDLPKLKRPGFGNTHDMVQSAIRRLRAGYAARDAEVEELRAWKAQALEVLGGWERVWEAAGMPGRLGEQKSECVRREVEELRAERDEWKGSANEWAEAFVDTADERDAALATLAKVQERVERRHCADDPLCGHDDRVWADHFSEVVADVRAILDESPTERETPTDEAPLKEVAAVLSAANESWDPARVTYREHTARYLLSEFKITKRDGSR